MAKKEDQFRVLGRQLHFDVEAVRVSLAPTRESSPVAKGECGHPSPDLNPGLQGAKHAL